MTKKNILPDGQRKRIRAALDLLRAYQLGPGFWGMMLIILLVAFVVTFEWTQTQRNYALGEIAEYDVMADRSFNFRNTEATRLRRDAVQKAQPVIATLNLEPMDNMVRRIKDWFLDANKAEDNPAAYEMLRVTISEELGEDITVRQFALMANPDFQGIMNNTMLPWMEERLRDGVVDDARKLSAYSGGVIIRNLETGVETVLSDTRNVIDIKDLQLALDRQVRSLPANLLSKKLVVALLGNMAMSTLTINDEATRQTAAEAAKSVQPVVQHVSEGEIIIRQGEKISSEQLVKLNALLKRNTDRFKKGMFIGVWGGIMLMSMSLFFSPSGKKVSFIRQKDMLFIGSMLLFMVFLAKASYMIGFVFSSSSFAFTSEAPAFAVPVPGVAGLAALTLTAKRHYTTSMLMAFVCTLVAKGGIGLFIYYFLGSMVCAWLVVDTQSRKEVVWAIIPLTVALLMIWLPTTLLQGGEYNRYFSEILAVMLGSLLSIVIIFAFSPVVEIIFGFTTRFVLMELMNQEHEVLQQLMLEAPGTYHHSIIVANMAELAAKQIGAHSLLCKVGGIYHDIGKTDKADYFIENQFKIANPHDRLTPAMSSLVLISHVKRGIELAQQYRLGPEITDIIRQHHGTSLIRYFYHKAQGLNPSVSEVDYRYAGPKPQSREAALIMLADVVEASSRTLTEPTPARIKAHVQKIIRGILAEGQLDNTDMTLKDLDKVSESFVIILTGIFHKRIEYPEKVPAKPATVSENGRLRGQPMPPDIKVVAKEKNGIEDSENYNASQWLAGNAEAPRGPQAWQLQKGGTLALHAKSMKPPVRARRPARAKSDGEAAGENSSPATARTKVTGKAKPAAKPRLLVAAKSAPASRTRKKAAAGPPSAALATGTDE